VFTAEVAENAEKCKILNYLGMVFLGDLCVLGGKFIFLELSVLSRVPLCLWKP
jgi:hypothetical protein